MELLNLGSRQTVLYTWRINKSKTGRYLCLNHGRTLGEEHFDRLEHVDDAFVPHPLQHDAQRHEHARATDPGTAPPPSINLIYGDCLEVRGEIIRTVLCCIVC